MKIDRQMLRNRSYFHTPTHFSPIAPERIGADPRTAQPVETGALVQPNGDVIFRMYAPEAKSVTVDIAAHNIRVNLQKQDDGIWEGIFPYQFSGPKATEWRVDGTYVLHPYASVYFSYGRTVNYVDIPDPEMEYVMIRDVPHGTVSHEYFYSKATENFESCLVYTPPGYETGKEKYPILYLQHGHGEGETSWIFNGKTNFILDNLIAEGKCRPFIVVMNDGMIRTKEDGEQIFGNFQGFTRMLLEDCMPFIEGKYRVLGDKWNRGLAGLSMGSMQTSIIGLKHPELFGWLGLFSGFMCSLGGGRTVEEQPHLKACLDPQQMCRDFRLFFRGIGEDDNLKPAFDADDEFCAAHHIAPGELPIHIRKIYPGIHDWNVWRRCIHDFSQLIFRD